MLVLDPLDYSVSGDYKNSHLASCQLLSTVLWNQEQLIIFGGDAH